jgi:divalent metal cation (Fe/Co/Zn/Cd) transporter
MPAQPPIPNARTYSAALILILIALPAIIGEAVQHLIELEFGMYARGDGIAAGHETNVRMIGAAVKVIGFVCTIFLARSRSDLLIKAKSMSLTTKGLALALPLVAHYVLNFQAVGKSDWIVLSLIFLDCFVVGCLALALGLVMPKKRMRRLP